MRHAARVQSEQHNREESEGAGLVCRSQVHWDTIDEGGDSQTDLSPCCEQEHVRRDAQLEGQRHALHREPESCNAGEGGEGESAVVL